MEQSDPITEKSSYTKYFSPNPTQFRGSVRRVPRPRRLSLLQIALLLIGSEAILLILIIIVLSRLL